MHGVNAVNRVYGGNGGNYVHGVYTGNAVYRVTCVNPPGAARGGPWNPLPGESGGAMPGGDEGRTTHVRVYMRTKRELDKLARKNEPYAKVIEEAVELLARKGKRG